MKLKIIIIITASVLISSCGLFNKQKVSLYTNKPELAAYIEIFNATQPYFRIEINYHPEPRKLIFDNKGVPDIIIGKDLNDPEAMQKFRNLDDILQPDQVNPRIFYPELLQAGRLHTEQKLIPVNYNLPAVLFNDNLDDMPSLLIPIDEIKTKSLEFNETSNKNINKIGYYPLWNNEFLYIMAILNGANFRLNQTGQLIWEETELDKSIKYLKNWISAIGEDYPAIHDFEIKYLHEPPFQLIHEKEIIMFYFSDSQAIYNIPKEKMKYLSYRWISQANKIYVNEDMIFMGIPGAAANINGAKAFIKWFYKRENQKKMLETNNFERLEGIFGIASGFSSMIEVNEIDFPKYYPLFLGHIPKPEYLLFPQPLPAEWQKIKRDALVPWMKNALLDEKYDKKLADLLLLP
ncbi:MAG: hypothetical protein JW969_06235 [Spirochaetales bacterium]|nr:hypothetical protein [Spirochaetales bacterium]